MGIPGFPAVLTLDDHTVMVFKLPAELHAFFDVGTFFNQMMGDDKPFLIQKRIGIQPEYP